MTDVEQDAFLLSLGRDVSDIKMDVAVIKSKVTNGLFVTKEDCNKRRLSSAAKALWLIAGATLTLLAGWVLTCLS